MLSSYFKDTIYIYHFFLNLGNVGNQTKPDESKQISPVYDIICLLLVVLMVLFCKTIVYSSRHKLTGHGNYLQSQHHGCPPDTRCITIIYTELRRYTQPCIDINRFNCLTQCGIINRHMSRGVYHVIELTMSHKVQKNKYRSLKHDDGQPRIIYRVVDYNQECLKCVWPL